MATNNGVVSERKARSTRTVVRVIDNRDGWYLEPAEENPWVTECMDHEANCSHPTRDLATWHSTCPEGWCQGCQDIIAAREHQS